MATALRAVRNFSQFGVVARAGELIPSDVIPKWGAALTNRLQSGDVEWVTVPDATPAPAAPAAPPVQVNDTTPSTESVPETTESATSTGTTTDEGSNAGSADKPPTGTRRSR